MIRVARIRCCPLVRSSTSVSRSRALERHWRTWSGGDQHSGNRPSHNSSGNHRASARSVFARRLRPRSALVSTGSARCARHRSARAPGTRTASPCTPQPDLHHPAGKPNHPLLDRRRRRLDLPPPHLAGRGIQASTVICRRCTSNPATTAPGSSPTTNGAHVTTPASRPPDAIPSLTVGPPIRMTGGAGCNRARLQPKSFDTEGRPPASASEATRRRPNHEPAHVIFCHRKASDGAIALRRPGSRPPAGELTIAFVAIRSRRSWPAATSLRRQSNRSPGARVTAEAIVASYGCRHPNAMTWVVDGPLLDDACSGHGGVVAAPVQEESTTTREPRCCPRRDGSRAGTRARAACVLWRGLRRRSVPTSRPAVGRSPSAWPRLTVTCRPTRPDNLSTTTKTNVVIGYHDGALEQHDPRRGCSRFDAPLSRYQALGGSSCHSRFLLPDGGGVDFTNLGVYRLKSSGSSTHGGLTSWPR